MNLRKLGPVALITLAGVAPVLAQSTTTSPTGTTGPGSIANVTCADIASLPAAYQAALIYYAAGYRDGLDAPTDQNGKPIADPNASSSMSDTSSAMSGDSSSSSSSTMSTDTSSSSAMSGDTSSSAMGTDNGSAMLGGLGLQAQDIVTACGSAGTALLIDVINNNGGSAGMMGTGTGTGTTSSSGEMSTDNSSSASDMSSSSSEMSSSSSASDTSSSASQ